MVGKRPERYVLDTERRVLRLRPHWVMVVRPIAETVGIIAVPACGTLDPSVVAITDPDYLMTIENFIGWIGISRRTYNQWCQDGTAPKRLKLGRHVRIRWCDCLEWIESRYVK